MALPYLWIAIVGGIFAFILGCAIGANDLANSFGTSYGSRVLRLRHIVIIAAICEFGGAVTLGKQVTATMAKGIASTDPFEDEPYVLMYGMLCTLFSAFSWIFIATYLCLPVSTTHSVAGGIIGFALVYGGGSGVVWAGKKSSFPFVKGFTPIAISWIASPFLTGLVSALVFLLLRTVVLRSKNSVRRAIFTLPVAVFVTCLFESIFILYKGAASRLKWPITRVLWVSVIVATVTGLLSIALVPLLRKKVKRMEEDMERQNMEESGKAEGGQNDTQDGVRTPDNAADAGEESEANRGTGDEEQAGQASEPNPLSGEAAGALSSEPAPAASNESEDRLVKKFARIQRFDKRAEYIFRYLQVFTAICMSFAHGASDVSNAIGPYTAIYHIYKTGTTPAAAEVPIWLLCLGGAGIIVGLATYGLKILTLMGEKITLITPSRGFSAELSTALVVSFASAFGIPVSTTHCITGGVVALSIVDLGIRNIQWKMALKMYAGWIFTIFGTALLSAVVFAQGIYAPSRTT